LYFEVGSLADIRIRCSHEGRAPMMLYKKKKRPTKRLAVSSLSKNKAFYRWGPSTLDL
jgi:hypothetical protein